MPTGKSAGESTAAGVYLHRCRIMMSVPAGEESQIGKFTDAEPPTGEGREKQNSRNSLLTQR